MSEYKLYQGDCLEVMKNIPDKSIDLILTDPPYFNAGKTRSDWDKKFNIATWWEIILQKVKKESAIVIFGNEPFSSKMRLSANNLYKYDIKWIKNHQTGFANANYRPMNKYEDIMVFSQNNASSGGKKMQ